MNPLDAILGPVSRAGATAQNALEVARFGGLDWEHKVTDTTTVYNNFAFEAAKQNNFVRNETGVSVAMTSRMPSISRDSAGPMYWLSELTVFTVPPRHTSIVCRTDG